MGTHRSRQSGCPRCQLRGCPTAQSCCPTGTGTGAGPWWCRRSQTRGRLGHRVACPGAWLRGCSCRRRLRVHRGNTRRGVRQMPARRGGDEGGVGHVPGACTCADKGTVECSRTCMDAKTLVRGCAPKCTQACVLLLFTQLTHCTWRGPSRTRRQPGASSVRAGACDSVSGCCSRGADAASSYRWTSPALLCEGVLRSLYSRLRRRNAALLGLHLSSRLCVGGCDSPGFPSMVVWLLDAQHLLHVAGQNLLQVAGQRVAHGAPWR